MFLAFAKIENDFTSRTGKDLHVFTSDEENLNQSLDHFFDLYASRTRKSRNFWMLDLTSINVSVKELFETKLKELPNLDLDDDLYVVEWNQPESTQSIFDVPV